MKRDTKILVAFAGAIPTLILGASALCAWAISLGASMQWRLLFRVMCHGRVDRSLELFGVPMPICARCTGIYLGLLVGLMLGVVWASGLRFRGRPEAHTTPERFLRTVAFAALIPLAIDGLTQAVGFRESTNALRIATGVVAGLAFGFWILAAVERRDEAVFTAP